MKIKESGSLKAKSGKWLVQLISEGVGSSGTYPGEVLERDGAAAWPIGTHIYADHLTESDEYERSGSHSIRDLVGVTLSEAKWDAESKSLRTEAKWLNGFGDFIEEAKDYIALSIEAAAHVNEGVVESILPSQLNAVAVVPRGGRDGKVLQLIESYRESYGNISPNENDEGKVSPVTPEDIQKVAEAVALALEPSLTKISEALKPVEAPPAEDETEGIDRAEVTEAAVEAGLSKTARARVLVAVDGGATVAEAIDAEKALRDEILKEAQVDPVVVGRIRESGSSNETFTGGWNK